MPRNDDLQERLMQLPIEEQIGLLTATIVERADFGMENSLCSLIGLLSLLSEYLPSRNSKVRFVEAMRDCSDHAERKLFLQ
jgi:hypothetical protein